jgi:hypothetical protein
MEMMQLLQGLSLDQFSPRTYIVADTDAISESKAHKFEQSMKSPQATVKQFDS